MIALLEGLKIVAKTQPNAEVQVADGEVLCGMVSLTSPADRKLMEVLDWEVDDGWWKFKCVQRGTREVSWTRQDFHGE
jgi:hypothetical protein